MKTLIVTLALLTGAAQAAPLKLKVIQRMETPAAIGNPVEVKEADGSRTLVQLEELSDPTERKYNYRLVAYLHGGRETLETKAGKPQPGQGLFIADAHRNALGELVVLTNYSRDSGTLGRVYSDNLNTKKSAMIVEGKFATLMDRVRFRGQNLALVSSDLGTGPNDTRPELIRVVNEDDGKVISQVVLNFGASGDFGVNSRGELKAVLRGYEIFALLDPLSGQVTELMPERRQPSAYPVPIHLSIGDFLSIDDANGFRLLDKQALLDGEVKVIRTFAKGVYFLGGENPDKSVELIGSELIIKDLATGDPIGKGIPTATNPRASRHVISVTDGPEEGPLALTSELKVPNSFLPGTILTYIRLQTGEVLRQTSSDMQQMTGQVFVRHDRPVSLEVRDSVGVGKAKYELVDIIRGAVFAKGDGLLLNRALMTPSGRILGLVNGAEQQVCFLSLDSLAEKVCTQDPLIVADTIHFGYRPFEMEANSVRVTLPLVKKASEFHYANMGVLDLEVKE